MSTFRCVTPGGCELRAQPRPTLSVPEHGLVQVIGSRGDWSFVRHPSGAVGWMPSSELQEDVHLTWVPPIGIGDTVFVASRDLVPSNKVPGIDRDPAKLEALWIRVLDARGSLIRGRINGYRFDGLDYNVDALPDDQVQTNPFPVSLVTARIPSTEAAPAAAAAAAEATSPPHIFDELQKALRAGITRNRAKGFARQLLDAVKVDKAFSAAWDKLTAGGAVRLVQWVGSSPEGSTLSSPLEPVRIVQGPLLETLHELSTPPEGATIYGVSFDGHPPFAVFVPGA